MILELFWQCVFFSFYFIHKSGLTPPLFIEVPVPSQKSERSYICWFGVGLCCLTPLFIEVPVPSHEKWVVIHLWVWGLAYVGCLTPLFIEVPVPSHESERSYICGFGVGLCCLTSLSTIFQLYRDGQLYWWENGRKPPTYIIGVVIAMILV